MKFATSLTDLNPQSALKVVKATAISGLWLESVYTPGSALCSLSAVIC